MREKNVLNHVAEEVEEHFFCIIKSFFVLSRPISFTISNCTVCPISGEDDFPLVKLGDWNTDGLC